jgi:antitoxin component of MazEF toxin-antitoxin module
MGKTKFKMEWQRKLVQIHGSHYLGLPPSYVKAMKVRRNDEFTIEFVPDGSLIVKPVRLKVYENESKRA